MSTITNIFKLPDFPDEDMKRAGNILGITMLTIFLVAVIRVVLADESSDLFRSVVNTQLITMMVVFSGLYLLLRFGCVYYACIAFTVYQLFVVMWLTYHNGGVTLSVYSFFIFVILASGLLLGGKWAIGYTIISVLYGVVLLRLENLGIITPVVESTETAFLTITPSFITTAVLVYLYHHDITNLLTKIRNNAAQLEKTNSRLHQEITTRIQAERQLLHAQKMEAIGRLSGGIAHDLNNLLAPIIGYTELSMMKLPKDHEIHKHLATVKSAAERADTLTDQILAFSRKQILEMEVLDLNQAINNFKNMLGHLLGDNIILKTNLSTKPTRIKADKSQIEQVLMNLVVNAADAMPDGGTVTINTEVYSFKEELIEAEEEPIPPGHYVLLSVSDTGHGMDTTTKKRIFEPFYTTKKFGKGTGLGLSTVFGIVSQHAGKMRVLSEPDKGTTFQIYLPKVSDQIVKPPPMDQKAHSIYGTETVLVVEDEELVRNLICTTLSEFGYKVIETKSVEECLSLISNKDIVVDLLLTDVIMPELNGKELYNILLGSLPGLKVLYISGYADDIITHQGILDEGVNFLKKPFTVRTLTTKVRQILD